MGDTAAKHATWEDLEALPSNVVGELIPLRGGSVTWMWIIDLDARTLTASRNHESKWLELAVWSDSDLTRAEPFDQVELRGEELWGSSQ